MTETWFGTALVTEACGRSETSVKRVLNPVKQVLNTVKLVPNTVKLVPNTVKLVIKQSKTQSNGRLNLLDLNKPVWDPETHVCSDTPRFS